MLPNVLVLHTATRDEFRPVPPGGGLAVVHPDGTVAHLRKAADSFWRREEAA